MIVTVKWLLHVARRIRGLRRYTGCCDGCEARGRICFTQRLYPAMLCVPCHWVLR